VTGGSISSRALAFLAAVAAAMAPILGREILSVDSEARWIRARATAEAIKSECFRFAAQLGDYDGASARAAFIARRNTLSQQAERAGLTPLPDPVPSSGDARRPPFPLTMPWYIEHRLDEQMRYYANGQTENEEGVRRYRRLCCGRDRRHPGCGGIQFRTGMVCPWVGVMTTLAAAATAYGLLDRRQYLAGCYGAMVTRLSRIKERSRTVRATCRRWSRPQRICCRANTAPGSSALRRRLQHRAIWHRRRRVKTTARSMQKASIRTKPEVHWSMKEGLSPTA
jgi:hypothetical protein